MKYTEEENPMAKIPLHRFPGLVDLRIVNSPTITNRVFEVIAENCPLLTHLEFGGKPDEYNSFISLDGIRILWGSPDEDKGEYSDEDDVFHESMGLQSSLQTIKIYYWVKVGEQAIELISNRFGDSLKSLWIYRNFNEFSAKITDEALISLEKWSKLEQLEIVYSRNFDWDWVNYLAIYCKNLKILNLKDCPIQESFEPLAQGCPFLEELNMSGDSWVKEEALVGLCKHQNLKIYYLGHFEHGDIDWLEIDEPEKGKFIGKLLSSPSNLPNLEKLFLEKWWLSMYIQDSIMKNREEVEVII